MARVVTVACNLPHGLVLQLCQFRDENVPVMGGGFRLEKVGRKVGEQVTAFGNSRRFGEEAKTRVIAGYAMTDNVNAEFWDEWLKQNAEHDAVKNKLIFAYERAGESDHEAKELKGTRSGLEPMDMSMTQKGDRKVARDQRVPRAAVAGVSTPLSIGPNE